MKLIGKTAFVRRALLCTSAALALSVPFASAQAQDAAASENEEADAEIIVTGTARARIALDTPLSITTMDEEALARVSTSSQADILNTIPSIKADSGGGEVASNVFLKGLPSGGQFQFTPLMYDGIPVMSTFGLNSSAYDVYYRNDLGVKRLEFVRGGVSNLFGPGSVAGLINYITKTGGDTFEGTAQLEVAEKGRYKADVAVSGPLSENVFYAVSGFYRKDDGPIRTNLDTEGYQIRGNLKFAFPDDSGSVTVYGQYIDDKVHFYLPVPLDGTTRSRAPGNDGKVVNSVQNNFDFASLGFNTPDGPFSSSIADGVSSKGGQVAIAFEKDFGDSGWAINGRVKYSDYAHKFGLWSDGDGIVNVPETLSSFVTSTARRGAIPELNGITAANASYTFVGGGAVPASTLLFANRFTDRDRPMTDLTAEMNLSKEFSTGGIEHSLTVGSFYANVEAKDINVTTTYLAEFNNQPRLVNLTVTNPVTLTTRVISRNGLLNAGAGYTNNDHKVERYAAYIAEQMEGERFNFDIGFRIEKFKGEISRERTSTVVTDATTANLSNALRDVIWGNDLFTTGKVDTSEWALAAGALYKVTDQVSVYANASRGYFFPEVRSVTFNALFQPASFEAEIIKQGEVGVKISQPTFSFTAGLFATKLDNRRQVLFVNDGAGGFREQVNIVGTKSWGAEATMDIKLIGDLRFMGNLTLQKATYTDFDTAPANIGKDLERQPQLLYNAGLYYDNGTLDAAFFTNYTGDNFTAATNAIRLKGWNIANFDAGYTVDLGGAKSVRLGVNVFNVFNTDAVTEGSPRQDSNQTTGGAYFVGRPVLPRRISGRLTFNF